MVVSTIVEAIPDLAPKLVACGITGITSPTSDEGLTRVQLSHLLQKLQDQIKHVVDYVRHVVECFNASQTSLIVAVVRSRNDIMLKFLRRLSARLGGSQSYCHGGYRILG